jgi:hypothetical protein
VITGCARSFFCEGRPTAPPDCFRLLPSTLTIKPDFIKPFENHNVAEFALKTRGDSTSVTWAMHGPNPYIAKVMHVFFYMDRMIGKDFELGLANLKTAAET